MLHEPSAVSSHGSWFYSIYSPTRDQFCVYCWRAAFRYVAKKSCPWSLEPLPRNFQTCQKVTFFYVLTTNFMFGPPPLATYQLLQAIPFIVHICTDKLLLKWGTGEAITIEKNRNSKMIIQRNSKIIIILQITIP